jgi:ribonuclease HI
VSHLNRNPPQPSPPRLATTNDQKCRRCHSALDDDGACSEGHVCPLGYEQQIPQTAKPQTRSRSQPLPQQSRPRGPQFQTRQQSEWKPPSPNLIIKFDGAYRTQFPAGTKTIRCAFGVFVADYSSPYSIGRVVIAHSNQAAELLGAIHAAKAGCEIFEKHSTLVESIVLTGDAHYVIGQIKSGCLLAMKSNSRFPNNKLWLELKHWVEKLSSYGIPVDYTWIPRRFNAESDELCNAALDNRPPNIAISSPPPLATPISLDLLHRCVKTIQTFRLPTIQMLPTTLIPLWQQFVWHIVERGENETTRLLLWIAPYLMSHTSHSHSVQNRKDFKHLRCHLQCLQQEGYLEETCLALATYKPTPTTHQSSSPPNEKVIDTLCARGLFGKAIQRIETESEKEIVMSPFSDETIDAMKKLHPSKDSLPRPLPSCPLAAEKSMVFADIFNSVRKTKRGKSRSLSGWNRELMLPIVSDTPTPVKFHLANIFSTILCCNLSPTEKELLCDGVLLPFYYPQKKKHRPIVVCDYFLKIVLIFLLTDIAEKDPALVNGPQCCYRKGGCQTALHALIAAINNDDIISLDGQNAFNSVDRQPSFDYIESKPHIYGSFFAIFNTLYANPSVVRMFDPSFARESIPIPCITGTRQGCVSGLFLFATAILKVIEKYSGHMVVIVDDTYLLGYKFPVQEVIEDFGNIGLVMNGPKTAIWRSQHSTNRALPEVIHHAKVITEAATALGGIVPLHPNFDLNPYILKLNNKINSRFETILQSKTTLQNKMHMIFAASRFNVYHAGILPPCPQVHNFFSQLDKTQASVITTISESRNADHDSYVQIFSCIEDRGLGLIPYEYIHENAFQSAAETATPFLRKLGLIPAQRDLPICPESIAASVNRISIALSSGIRRAPNTKSWLGIWPKNSYTKLFDHEVLFGLQFLLKTLKPRAYHCPLLNKDLITLSSHDYCEHINTCRHCGSSNFKLRHDYVVTALCRTLRFHGITATSNPRDLPLPGNEKGGPDAIVHTNCMQAIDVAISKIHKGKDEIASMKARIRAKIKKYIRFKASTGIDVIAAVMSIYGSISSEFEKLLQAWAVYNRSATLKEDIENNIRCALLKGMANGVNLLHTRASGENVEIYDTDSSDEEEEPFNVPNVRTNTLQAPSGSNTVAPMTDEDVLNLPSHRSQRMKTAQQATRNGNL